MGKKKIIFFSLLLALFFIAIFYIRNYYELLEKRAGDFYEISVICRGKNMDNYSSTKAGIDQAADDLNSEVNYITLSKDNDAAQQVAMLKQEVKGGANAIIILPADSIKDVRPIYDAAREVPVVVLQHSVNGLSNVTTISCDEFQLGKALAQKIVKNESSARNINIKILQSGSHKNGSQLLSGITTILKNSDDNISYSTVPENSKDAYDAAKTALIGHENEVLVALDSNALEAAGKAKKDLLKSGISVPEKIYGIGRTDTIVTLLEEDIIQAVGVENEYSMGYLGVKIAVDDIQKKKTENSINVNFVVSDKSDMYYPKNEYMLFPFINY